MNTLINDLAVGDFFAYSGESVAGFSSQCWKVASASVTGPSHVSRGVGCDDAAAAATVSEWLVAVVCDGAGSAQFGAEGAALASAAIVNKLREHLLEGVQQSPLRVLIDRSLYYAREQILELSESRNISPKAAATTVVGVICRGRRGVLFHLGDGTGIALSDSLGVTALSLGTPKEYANETHFLSDETWHDHLQLTPLFAADRILLMTDGVTPFATNARECKSNFVEPIARYMLQYPALTGATALKRLLNKDEARRQVSDDKTLLWAGRDLLRGVVA